MDSPLADEWAGPFDHRVEELARALREIAGGTRSADWNSVHDLLRDLPHETLLSEAVWLVFQWQRCEEKLRKKEEQLGWITHTREALRARIRASREKKVGSAKRAAEIRHSQPNGYRSKAAEMRRIWASGKYKTRDECADKEYAGLGISRDTARKALRNAPEPDRRASQK